MIRIDASMMGDDMKALADQILREQIEEVFVELRTQTEHPRICCHAPKHDSEGCQKPGTHMLIIHDDLGIFGAGYLCAECVPCSQRKCDSARADEFSVDIRPLVDA